MATRYSLGERGAINLIGMYQREQSAFNRPPLGFEASANLIGGVNTELHFKPTWLTGALNKLVTKRTTAPSLLDVNAELAFTQARSQPLGPGVPRGVRGRGRGRRSLCARPVGIRQPAAAPDGLEDVGFGGGFDPDDAVALTWQNLVPGATARRMELRPQDIDTLIRIAGRGEQRRRSVHDAARRHRRRHRRSGTTPSRWTLPAARLPAALALDGHRR